MCYSVEGSHGFTYDFYLNTIENLRKNGYNICSYKDYKHVLKPAILRHDIDFSVEKAYKFAELETEAGICSTYFVLLCTDFYNIHSLKTNRLLKQMMERGAKIGLHFDETRYEIDDVQQIIGAILKEKNILENAIESPIDVVSMHRPSNWILKENIQIPGMINSYGKEFFEGFKYISDSRMNWRENVNEIISSGMYKRLHILTHAFWYHREPFNIRDILLGFIKQAQVERYENLRENIRDMEEFLSESDIKGV